MVKSLQKPTADDIRKISEYNRQVATQKFNELKEKKAKRFHEKKARMNAVEDDELYHEAYEKALDPMTSVMGRFWTQLLLLGRPGNLRGLEGRG